MSMAICMFHPLLGWSVVSLVSVANFGVCVVVYDETSRKDQLLSCGGPLSNVDS